jgi:hypothetical protein
MASPLHFQASPEGKTAGQRTELIRLQLEHNRPHSPRILA